MLEKLMNWLSADKTVTEVINERVAAAALMVNIATSDHSYDDVERTRISDLIKEKLKISDEESKLLESQAEVASNKATSIFEFTHVINEHYNPQQKFNLAKCLWEVAYADGIIDKYEEYMIRRVTDLIYLSQADFIRSRNAVRDRFITG